MPPHRLAFAPDGKTLASAEYGDPIVTLWDVPGRKKRAELVQHANPWALAFSRDNRHLAVASGWSVELWDAEAEQRRLHLKGHRDTIWSVAFSPNSGTVASAGSDGIVRLWDVRLGREQSAFDWQIGKIHTVAFSRDGTRAAAGGGEGDILIWDVA
jgi:WD40 repeat protein